VQHRSLDSSGTSATLAFNSNNTAGNWIGVCIRAGAANETFRVTDSRGNTYHKAIQFSETLDGNSFGIYYAENIGGGANTVMVSDTASATLRFAILEYSGVATSGSLDVVAATQGNSATPNSGVTATTTANGDLLLGAIMTANPATFTAGTGFVIEESVPAEPGAKLIAEDEIQATAGAAMASATLGAADIWAAGVAAFKPAGSGPPTLATPTFNPGAGTYSSAQTVTISSTTSGATICYTTNGTTPAANTPGTCSTGTTLANGGTVTVGVSETLQAIRTKSGLTNSAVGSAAYVIRVATPSITSLSPTSGPAGTSVTITGTNFGSTGTVTFGGATATVTSWSATSIATSVPTGVSAGNVNVVVTVNGVASNGMNFTVTSGGGGPGIGLVQHASLDSSGTSATLAFNSNNTAGNWIGVCIRAGH